MRKVLLLLFVKLIFIIPLSTNISAHEVRPGYLEITQNTEKEYNVLWKIPAKGGLRLGLYVNMPESCSNINTQNNYFLSDAYIEKWSLVCEEGLTDKKISIDGLDSTFTDVLVRIENIDGVTYVERLTPSSPSLIVPGNAGRLQIIRTYLVLGVEHILIGIDHLLFLVCLLLISGTRRRILITITGFTIAHSITLILSSLNIFKVPVPPVEAVIALSIIFVATEIVKNNKESLAYKYPITVSSSFGLLHGFGFASVLSEIGLPQNDVVASLLFFNVGVEIGQIIFVLAFLAAIYLLKTIFNKSLDYFYRFEKQTAFIIGCIASFWMIQRIHSFWF